MSKLQTWLKGQKSKKKDSKAKDDKTNSKPAPVAQTPPAPQVAASPNRDAKTPRPTLRHRIPAAGLHTKTSTPTKTSGLHNVITVIPEGRKEIHISVHELRRPTSNATETKPASNRLRDDILLASMNRANKQAPSKPVEPSPPRAAPVSKTQSQSVPSPSKAKESAPAPTAEATPLPTPSFKPNDGKATPKMTVETRPQSSKGENAKSPLHDEAEKSTTQPPAKVTRQVSEEIKKSVAREAATHILTSSPSGRSPKPYEYPSRSPVAKASLNLAPTHIAQKQPEVASSSPEEPGKAPTIPTPRSPSQGATETVKASSFQPNHAASISTSSTTASKGPVAESDPILTPNPTTQKQPEVANSISNEPEKVTAVPNSTGTSPRPTEATKASSSQPIQATSISSLATNTTHEKKAMNTSYHYSQTFPPPNPTGSLHKQERSAAPVSPQTFERVFIPQGLLSTPRTNTVTPLNQPIAPKPKPKKEAYILKLAPELLLQIASHLPYPATAFLKLTCLHLNRIMLLSHLTPTPAEKLSVVQAVRPRWDFKGDRNAPFLCKDCVMWHSFEHMIIWPHPRPENVFLNYADFKLQKPRRCVRFAVRSGEWVKGRRIGGEHVLCGKCVTPTARGECAWNCGRCGGCTGRKAWSGYCEGCWRNGDGDEIGKKGSCGQAGAWEYLAGSKWPKLNDEKRKRKVCGRCLGVLDFEPGSREVCRCGESHRATY